MDIALRISKVDHLEEKIMDERKLLKSVLEVMALECGLDYLEVIFCVIQRLLVR
jgi:hypothetical protein